MLSGWFGGWPASQPLRAAQTLGLAVRLQYGVADPLPVAGVRL